MVNNLKSESIKQFRKMIDVPTLDPDERRRSRLLNILVIGILLFAILSLIIATGLNLARSFDSEDLWAMYMVSIAVIAFSSILYIINRGLSGQVARGLFIFFLLALLAFSDDPGQVAGGRTSIAFTLPIIAASMLFPPYAAFIVAGLASAEIALIALSVNIGPDPFIMVTFFTIALMAWLLAYTMGRALRDLRVLNRELDQRVRDRTQELAHALEREHTLAEKERTLAVRNETILKSIADGVIVFDSKQNIIMANPSAQYLTGHNLPQFDLNIFLDTLDSEAGKNLHAWLLGEKPAEINNVKFEWNDRTISANVSPVMLSDLTDREISVGNVMVLRDFTREAELEKAKDMFLGMVSHELRTPLTSIQGFVEILLETTRSCLTETDYQYLKVIQTGAKQMFKLVEDLIDLSRMETGRLALYCQWIELPTLIDKATRIVEPEFAKRNLSLEIRRQDDLPELYVDPNRINQVLLNLLSNAYKYTSEGGVTIDISRTDTEVIVAIKDTGIGIKKSDQGKLFERFFRANEQTVQKAGGTGLGLNISKRLIEMHGGKLTFESKFGAGTTFTLMLPRDSKAIEEAEGAKS